MKNLIYAKQTLKGILKEIQKSFLNPSPAIPKLETILIQTTEGTEIVSYAIREQLPVTNKDHPHTANATVDEQEIRIQPYFCTKQGDYFFSLFLGPPVCSWQT